MSGFSRLLTGRGPALRQGERVAIFRPEAADRDDFLAMTRGSTSLHHPWIFPVTDAAMFRRYLARVTGRTAAGFLLRRRADSALVGAVNINDIQMGGFRTGSLGYYAHADHAGQGYMGEGLALVLDVAFGAMGLHRIEVNVQPDNAASLALIRRLGFRYEGFAPKFLMIADEWRDHERWAMLDEEWHARPDAGGGK